jgi:hypothetical protein
MSPEIARLLSEYLDANRIEKQREIQRRFEPRPIELARHMREMVSEARAMIAAQEIAEADRRSRSFLDAHVRDRSR